MSATPSKILVTGASGFLALHTVLQLLQQGYTVRGTVRTEAQARKTREALAKHTDVSKLEIVLADLVKDDGWREAVRECGMVLHLASPFPTHAPKDENEIIIPARDGTLRVLRAAQAEGIKKLVLLSSVAAVTGGHEREKHSFSEADWTDVTKTDYAYAKSKTLAEQAAWDFIRSAENKNGMEMVSINPSIIFGPVLDDHHHTSTEWFRTLMHHEVPGLTRTQMDVVDVRDVAAMVIKAMDAPNAVGKRFILNGASIQLSEFANILHRNFASRGYKVPTTIFPDWVVRVFAIINPKTRPVIQTMGWTYSLSSEQAKSVLGFQPRPYEKMIVEMGESLIEYRMV
jgi:dihydroflavonol-4-reductase